MLLLSWQLLYPLIMELSTDVLTRIKKIARGANPYWLRAASTFCSLPFFFSLFFSIPLFTIWAYPLWHLRFSFSHTAWVQLVCEKRYLKMVNIRNNIYCQSYMLQLCTLLHKCKWQKAGRKSPCLQFPLIWYSCKNSMETGS